MAYKTSIISLKGAAMRTGLGGRHGLVMGVSMVRQKTSRTRREHASRILEGAGSGWGRCEGMGKPPGVPWGGIPGGLG